MAAILIVDDDLPSREFLSNLLGCKGHRLKEAGDGQDALEAVRKEFPDLVISDILMPTMDGYELVRQLRQMPNGPGLPIILYTATYSQREAEALAKSCGITHILAKPTDPEQILTIIDTILLQPTAAGPVVLPKTFDPEHLQLASDKLAQKNRELEAANFRLNVLIELAWELASQRDPKNLLEKAGLAARKLVSARYAACGVLNGETDSLQHFIFLGADNAAKSKLGVPTVRKGLLQTVFEKGEPCRAEGLNGEPANVGLPPEHPPVHSFLCVPVRSLSKIYGWLYFVDKVGLEHFTEDDERIAAAIGTQTGVVYENIRTLEEIKLLNQNLEQRVAERTVDLETANKGLEAFNYSISHDLKAPLRAIQGFAKILSEELGGQLDEENGRLLKIIQTNASHMNQLLESLLAFSKMGQKTLTKEAVNLDDLLQDVQGELRHSYSGSFPAIHCGPLPVVQADRLLLRQVFVNLLSNAVKFTRNQAAPSIEVGADLTKTEMVLFVKDNGIGFDMVEAAKLFGVFQRLHSQQEFEGTGIGLAIVQRIVERHGGRVWAEGQVNAGATFYFTLPKE